MKALPKTAEEWRTTVLFCLAFPFLLFSLLPPLAVLVVRFGVQSTWTRGLTENAIFWIFRRYLFWPTVVFGIALCVLTILYLFMDRRRARWALFVLLPPLVIWFLGGPWFARAIEKPVIYLYPTRPMKVSVSVDYPGRILRSNPSYNEGWNVRAFPNGQLVDIATGEVHDYLFWEGVDRLRYSFDAGFVVSGERSAAFLRSTLPALGLIGSEIDDFVEYWGPRLATNRWNVIGFPTEQYCDSVSLSVLPKPDSMVRVFMVFAAIEEPVDLPQPVVQAPDRYGFTVVEWGGTELK